MKILRYYANGLFGGITIGYLITKPFSWYAFAIFVAFIIQLIWDITRKENN
jgi:hypothetical protein